MLPSEQAARHNHMPPGREIRGRSSAQRVYFEKRSDRGLTWLRPGALLNCAAAAITSISDGVKKLSAPVLQAARCTLSVRATPRLARGLSSATSLRRLRDGMLASPTPRLRDRGVLHVTGHRMVTSTPRRGQ